MIGKITGIIAEKNPPQILLESHGIAYEIDVPMSTFFQLPANLQTVSLYTHLIVREDAHLLYGFISKDEKETFKKLIKVSGIGPKIALAILSGMSVTELAENLHLENAARLAKIPGIGKKTAERLVLELKGKITFIQQDGPLFEAVSNNKQQASDEIEQALLALGYSEKEISAAIKTLPAECQLNEGIKLALKHLSRH